MVTAFEESCRGAVEETAWTVALSLVASRTWSTVDCRCCHFLMNAIIVTYGFVSLAIDCAFEVNVKVYPFEHASSPSSP